MLLLAFDKLPDIAEFVTALFGHGSMKAHFFRIEFVPLHPLDLPQCRDQFEKGLFGFSREPHGDENDAWIKPAESPDGDGRLFMRFAESLEDFFYFFYIFRFERKFQREVGGDVFSFCNVRAELFGDFIDDFMMIFLDVALEAAA
jgi:hypothetical protein